MGFIKPNKISKGDTLGVFSSSLPAYTLNKEMFELAIKNMERSSFKVKLGFLAKDSISQGYRSGSAQDRAKEFMDLIKDPDVKALISGIGGSNSNSLIPYLDFDEIRRSKKVICGYSDITSLHLAILKFSGLKTLYGPDLFTCFGDHPMGIQDSINSLITAITDDSLKPRKIKPFPKWSNHFRDWLTVDEWKDVTREWQENDGWKVLNPGTVDGELVLTNLETLLSSAGTPYFPDLKNKILLIEALSAPWSREERSLRHLQLLQVFEQIKGLIVGKPFIPDPEGAKFSLDDLILEIVGTRDYPIVMDFDCSHTFPMHTLQQRSKVSIRATGKNTVDFEIKESFVE
ncbi:MAG: LD-carboxypeptidase [Oligoflexales bacterium]